MSKRGVKSWLVLFYVLLISAGLVVFPYVFLTNHKKELKSEHWFVGGFFLLTLLAAFAVIYLIADEFKALQRENHDIRIMNWRLRRRNLLMQREVKRVRNVTSPL